VLVGKGVSLGKGVADADLEEEGKAELLIE